MNNPLNMNTTSKHNPTLKRAIGATLLTVALAVVIAAGYCPGRFVQTTESNTDNCSDNCTGSCATAVYNPPKGNCQEVVSGLFGCKEKAVNGTKAWRTGDCTGISKELGCGCNSLFGTTGDPSPAGSYTTGSLYNCG